MFTGDEQDYTIWKVRLLGYMALQGLKETILPSSTTVCYKTVDCLKIGGHMHYQQVDISGTVVYINELHAPV